MSDTINTRHGLATLICIAETPDGLEVIVEID